MPLRHSSLRECLEQIYSFFPTTMYNLFFQDHKPKIRFPSLPIGRFMKMVSRIIPVLPFYFSGVLFFSCGGSELEKPASCHSQNICLPRRESSRDYKQQLWGRGGRGADLLMHFASTQPSLTLFSWIDTFVPHTPHTWLAITIPYLSFGTLSHCMAFPACLCRELLLLFNRWTRKRQNIVVAVIWARIQMLRGLSLPNQWTNKQTNSLFFFFFLFWLKENISFSSKGNVSFPFSVSLTATNDGNKWLEADIALFSSAVLKHTKHRWTAFAIWGDYEILRAPHFRSTSSAVEGSYAI